jgi:hypothetical protein
MLIGSRLEAGEEASVLSLRIASVIQQRHRAADLANEEGEAEMKSRDIWLAPVGDNQ